MVQKLRHGLSGEQFAHPLDRAGIQRLTDLMAKSKVTKNLTENMHAEAEEQFYLLNLADNTKLSELQGSSVYRLVQEIAEILDTPIPSVFLDTTSEVNAYALGGTNHSIVLTSALVDTFPEPALRAVIAHELGHIICSHTFYRLLAESFEWFSKLVSLIPILCPLFSLGVQWALFDWYRKSELSGDRAALLGTQDLEAVQNCILRLSGGSSRLGNELRIPEFIEQAKEFQEKMKAKREQNIKERIKFLFSDFMLQHAISTHPWPAVRLQEISSWASSKQYALLLAGDYESALAAAPVPTDEDRFTLPAPPGEDIKEYVKDLGKVAGDALKGLFKRSEPTDDPDKK